MNPDDSAVQSRLAAAADAAGERDAALQAMRRAAEVNPQDRSLQDAYARGLIIAGKDAEAYAFYEKLLTRWPQDGNALLNYGVLAQKLGHPEQALDDWQRAVAADPTDTRAQLYVAQALEQRGEMLAAARHYRTYLEIVSKHPGEHAGEGLTVISALIKAADGDVSAGKTDEAIRGYQGAARFAEKMKNPGLQSLAMEHGAEAQEKAGNPGPAAQLFQEALMIDETQGEPRAAAVDWYNYGQFLMRQKQPERLVFPCFARAQDLMSSKPGQELIAMTAARNASAARLGASAHGLDRQTARLLSEALSLKAEAFPAAASYPLNNGK